MKLNVLVTGGAGYIGSNFCEMVVNNDNVAKVVIVDNLSTGHKEALIPNLKFYKADVLNTKKILKIMQKESINFVVHFAAKLVVPESVKMPIEYYENNVGGVISILKAMREANVKNIVFSSTAAVYGNPKKTPVDEDSEKNPINSYGSSKMACEYLLQAAKTAHDINYGIIRYFNVAGASELKGMRKEKPTLLIPVLSKSQLENREVSIFGSDYDTKDGTCIRDYIHVTDLCRAHVLLMEYMFNKNASEIINLGSGKGFSVKEVVSEFEKTTGEKVQTKFVERRPGDPAILITENKKALNILGWKPEHTLSDMIKSDYSFRQKLVSNNSQK